MNSRDSITDKLLAYHMGWLDRAAMEEVEGLIASSPDAASRHRELSHNIAPLADWTALPAVDDLESQILRRVQRSDGEDLEAVAEVVRLAPESSRSAKLSGRRISLRELLAIAACVTLLLVVVLPGLARASALSQRRACAENLRQIASALNLYTEDYTEQLPFAGAGGNWLQSGSQSNSRNRFLLLALGYVGDSSRFICPADREAVVMQAETFTDFQDFPEAQNCSYDSQIMSGRGLRRMQHPQMVVYSDPNPVFDVSSGVQGDPVLSNSRLHSELAGQNVMRLDGSVSWAISPEVGVQNDNIWQIGGRRSYAGSEWPQLATDSFMVP